MLIVWQRPQEVQLDLLGGWVLFLERVLEEGLEVVGLSAAFELLHVEANTPLPHL